MMSRRRLDIKNCETLVVRSLSKAQDVATRPLKSISHIEFCRHKFCVERPRFIARSKLKSSPYKR